MDHNKSVIEHKQNISLERKRESNIIALTLYFKAKARNNKTKEKKTKSQLELASTLC